MNVHELLKKLAGGEGSPARAKPATPEVGTSAEAEGIPSGLIGRSPATTQCLSALDRAWALIERRKAKRSAERDHEEARLKDLADDSEWGRAMKRLGRG